MVTEMNSDIKLSINPSYGIVKQNSKQRNECDYILHNESENKLETVKMDTNPSYGRVQGCNAYNVTEPEYDAAIQPNPSYSSIPKETSTKMCEDEDQHGYVETSLHRIQNERYLKVIGSMTKEEELVYDDVVDTVKINPNPSYVSVSSDVKLENNPSYNVINRT